MKTFLDCIPCFFKQAISACRMIGLEDGKIKIVLDEIGHCLSSIELSSPPPEMGRRIQKIIREKTGNADPYKQLKRDSNRVALALYPLIKEKVTSAENRLLKAVEIAIAGNIIDYGALSDLDIKNEVERIVNSEKQTIRCEDEELFSFFDLVASLEKAETILYLADNAGEAVFDRVLLEEIVDTYPYKKIYFAVRGRPIINDCLTSDALECGIQNSAEIVSNGSDAPGTLLHLCSEEFNDLFNKSDMIISKGQGNFESISGTEKDIFFMLVVKCNVLANFIGCKVRDAVLKKQQH